MAAGRVIVEADAVTVLIWVTLWVDVCVLVTVSVVVAVAVAVTVLLIVTAGRVCVMVPVENMNWVAVVETVTAGWVVVLVTVLVTAGWVVVLVTVLMTAGWVVVLVTADDCWLGGCACHCARDSRCSRCDRSRLCGTRSHIDCTRGSELVKKSILTSRRTSTV